MKETLEKILLLQRLNGKIETCKKDREALWLDIQKEEGRLHELEEQLSELREQLVQAQKAADLHEVKIKGAEAENKRLQTQLNTTKHQREYDAIRSAIISRLADIEKWEDEELELLETVDDAKRRIRDGQEQAEKLRQALQDLRRQVEQGQRKYDLELAELGAKREALRKGIDPEVLAAYERIADSRGGEGLAQVRGRVCQGCYTTITKQMENELMRGEKAVYCASCARLLMLVQ